MSGISDVSDKVQSTASAAMKLILPDGMSFQKQIEKFKNVVELLNGKKALDLSDYLNILDGFKF